MMPFFLRIFSLRPFLTSCVKKKRKKRKEIPMQGTVSKLLPLLQAPFAIF